MEIALGFFIAFIVGVTGMGGGPLATPLLMIVLAVPAMEAVGTSLIFVTITKAAAAAVYFWRKQIDWPWFGRLLVGGAPGVLIGTFLLQGMSKDPKLQPIVLSLIGAIIISCALLSLWRLYANKMVENRRDRPYVVTLLGFLIAIEYGFSSAGAGALTSLVLLHFTNLEPKTIVGTDLMFGLAIATLAGSVHLSSGNLNTSLLYSLSIGGIVGALVGALIGTRLPSRFLRFGLSLVMIFLGQQLLWKGMGW